MLRYGKTISERGAKFLGKKKDKIRVSFVGQNASEVTGSMTLVYTEHSTILIDCGLYQSNNTKSDFAINSKLPKEIKSAIKKDDLKYVLITHLNIDHHGLLPLLINSGYHGEIIMPNKSREIAKKMLLDGYNIMIRDAELLGKSPYYTKEDVYEVLNLIYEVPLCKEFDLDEYITIEARSAGHLIGSAQFKIKVNQDGCTKSIIATGDLGSKYSHNPFLEPLQPFHKADLIIGECTYGNPEKSINKDVRHKDIEKLECVIEEATRVGASVLIPSFSFGRTQQVLYELWNMYKDRDFPYKVVIDSPLSCALTNIMSDIEDSGILKEILEWDNLILSSEHKTHLALMTNKRSKIIIASSGFMKFGRSVSWAQYLLPRKNNVFCFVGYSSETSLAGKIKKGQKQITIAGKKYKNKAEVVNLRSFSSHMQSEELLDYYSSINSNNVCLVHGDMETKLIFAELLKERFEKENKSTKVTVVNKGTVVAV